MPPLLSDAGLCCGKRAKKGNENCVGVWDDLCNWLRCLTLSRRRPALATKRYRSYTLRIMSRRITQRELRNDSAAVLRDVQAGETVTVTRNGTPIAELRPVSPRRFVPRAAIANARARTPRVDFRRLRSDLDAVASPFIDE